MPDTQTAPDYKQCLPVELHDQADAFIRYLQEMPNKSPVECVDCGHLRFRLEASMNLRLPFYRCAACNKGCNSLSQIPFSGFGLMHLWPSYAKYLLAGWSMRNTAIAMGISPSTTWRWIKPSRAVMAKEFPALYRWWSARQDRTDLEPPPHIAAQTQAFIGGLEYLLTTRQADCSRCGAARTQRIDERCPVFRCHNCGTMRSLLTNTLLSRLGHPEQWLGFAQGLINGESITDLQRRAGLCSTASKRWQTRFMQMMEQQGHTELTRWITWLRSRRVKEVSDFVREGGRMEEVAGSRYSAGSNRRLAAPPNNAGFVKPSPDSLARPATDRSSRMGSISPLNTRQ